MRQKKRKSIRWEKQAKKKKKKDLKECLLASPPDMNSFHVSSLPTCPNANVYGGRLSHLMMSFPSLLDAVGLKVERPQTWWSVTWGVAVWWWHSRLTRFHAAVLGWDPKNVEMRVKKASGNRSNWRLRARSACKQTAELMLFMGQCQDFDHF